MSPAGLGHVQEQWEGHSVSELAGDGWGKASATERLVPHNMREGEKVLAERSGWKNGSAASVELVPGAC